MSQNATAQPAPKEKTAITPTRAENFPEWYQEVIKAADMAENSAVRGCMVIKPYGYAIWENVQQILGQMIKDVGVQNAYFPLLIPLSYLSKEAEHIDGFAKECAVVTHHRLEKGPDGKLVPAGPLTEPFVIRPTSETIIGETVSKWIQSYRDLPLKLNQWCNIMRWEMRPRLFLRTSEFLWQEGHNCFATAEEASADARLMLDVYADFLENTLAIHLNKGEKTADERFPGAIHTYTAEAMMQDGKAIQSCTSHDLGQTFSKGANIQFQGTDGQQHFAHTTSWGLSTRVIGGLIMTHADDDGLVMPPRIAPYHVTIIPVFKDETKTADIKAYCTSLQARLKAAGIRVHMDLSDERASNKMWTAIKKGIPVRIEAGANEMAATQVTVTRRDLGKSSKQTLSVDELVATLPKMLDDMHNAMLKKSKHFTNDHIYDMNNVGEIRDFFAKDTPGFIRMPVELLDDPAMNDIRKEFAVTPRCLPFADAGRKVLMGKSY
jgi:prolyl-tRNA synthetase